MIASYQHAFELSHEPGVIRFQQLLLEELKPLDDDGLLDPVHNLLAESVTKIDTTYGH